MLATRTHQQAAPSVPQRLADVNLATPEAFRDGFPHAMFELLRREAPIYLHPAAHVDPFWVISRYKDIWDVSLDQATFSSAKRGTILKDWPEDNLLGVRQQMLNMDPPKHTKYRRLVNMGFSPKMVNRLEPHIREMAAKIVDAVARRGACDFVTDIAAELPLQVIVEMMGVPLEDRHLVFQWSNRMIGFDDPDYSASEEDGKAAAMEMFMYAHELAQKRKAEPREDLVSVLMQAEVEGEKLDESQFNNFFLLLAVAGNETTRNLISGGMLALFRHPDQLARLVREPSLMPTAVEEMLRWVSPVMYFVRTATRDVELRGHQIKEGQRVTLWYGSANRDEEMFENGDAFDVARKPNDHLAFGIGPHFCLGANLARLEIRVMFEEIVRRLPDVALAGPVARLRSNFIHGIKSMPVRFTPER